MRKHPRGIKEDADGNIMPPRRAHGIYTSVKPSPSALRRAQQRARFYMHSAARRRLSESAS